MVTPDEEYDQYVKDPRTTCKFGATCYQRNPLHHQKYKHPPKKRVRDQEHSPRDTQKKQKLDESEKQPKIKISNDISDSENESSNEAEITQDPESEIEELTEPVTDNTTEVVKEAPELQASNVEVQKRTPVSFDKKEFIKEKFLVEMPEDFYLFWDFCKTLKTDNPSNALASVGLVLVGPYDVLAGKFSNMLEKSPEEYLIHWRYYYDPPEFQTVLKGNESTGYHIGYFRDDPKELPIFMANNRAKKDGEFSIMGENIFAAVWHYLEESKKSCDPFKKLSIAKLQGNVKKHAEKLNLDLSEKTSKMQERDKRILVRSFNKIGLIVPYNRKTQVGYRHLCVSDKELRKLLDRLGNASEQQKDKVLSEIQPILTATSIAIDECDFGTGLELGWDILAHGVGGLNSTIGRFLNTAYELLQRNAFANIASAHMKNRRNGTNLSIL